MDGNGVGVGQAEKEYKNTFIHMSIERDLINFNLYRMCGMCEFVYVRVLLQNTEQQSRGEESRREGWQRVMRYNNAGL